MFNGLPQIFDDKVQNTEIYVQKRIYDSLKFLNLLPIEQNDTGLFTNYINGKVNIGKPLYTNNGINFNQIEFGKGTAVGGQTLPLGFMYSANTRDKQRGKYNSNLLSFYNTAVVQIADFFEEKYAKAIFDGGRASTATLNSWDTAEHIVDNEVILEDEMRYNADGNRTGFAPTVVLTSRKDKLTIDSALRNENYNSNYQYIASNKSVQGDFIVMDTNNPGASIEKYADPDYSIIQSLADDGITETADGTPIPPAFINLKEEDIGRPQTVDNCIWVESNLNIRDSNGFLVIDGS